MSNVNIPDPAIGAAVTAVSCGCESVSSDPERFAGRSLFELIKDIMLETDHVEGYIVIEDGSP